MKPSKTDPSGEQAFKKTFLVDPDKKAVSAGLAITTILHTRGIKEGGPVTKLPLFLDPETGKEVKIAASHIYLARKVKQAGLSPEHVRGHFLRIVGATAYDNSPSGGAITVGFLGL